MANKLLAPDVALSNFLYYLTTIAFDNGSAVSVGLYGTDYTPANSDTYATYAAIEIVFAGYAPQDPRPWTVNIVSPGLGRATGTTVSFTPSGVLGAPVICYGYFLSSGAAAHGDRLVYAQKWDAPFVFIDTTTVLTFTPLFDMLPQP